MLFYTFFAVVGLLVGVYVLYSVSSAVLGLFFSFCALIFVLILMFKKSSCSLSYITFVIFAAIGVLLMNFHSITVPYVDDYVTVSGRVSELPYISDSGSYCYTLDCATLSYGGTETKFKTRISLYSENEYPLGSVVSAEGFLKQHETAKNPGCFNAYTYYKAMDVDYKMSALYDKMLSSPKSIYTPYALSMTLRDKIRSFSEKHFSPENSVILTAIMTGFKKDLDKDYSDILNTSGVLRCLYSPYYHLVLMTLFLNLITKTSIRRKVLYALCLLYIVCNPYSHSGQKLFILTALTEFMRGHLKIFRRIDCLWLTILFCALRNPFVLFSGGFIMSCTATFYIILFYPKIFDPLRATKTKKKLIRLSAFFIASVALTAPIGAFLFDGISILSVFVSMLLLPIICTIFAFFPFMAIFSRITVIFVPLKLFVNSLLTFVRILPLAIEKLPFSFLLLPTPSLLVLTLLLFITAAFYLRHSKKSRKALVSICLGLSLSCGVVWFHTYKSTTVTFLNVGQGDCALINSNKNCTILVDGGGGAEYEEYSDVGKRDVLPYLRRTNNTTLDYVFLSHYHKDHADGIASLAENVKINNIFLPECLPESKYRVIIEEKAKMYGINVHYISEPCTIKLKGGAVAEILYFDKDADDENDTSVVMRISAGNTSCLFTGDITTLAESKILKQNISLKADILKVPHHGSKKSNSIDFIRAVAPKFAVASLSENNNYGFPAEEALQNYRECNVPFITTAEYGCIQFNCNRRLTWQRKIH